MHFHSLLALLFSVLCIVIYAGLIGVALPWQAWSSMIQQLHDLFLASNLFRDRLWREEFEKCSTAAVFFQFKGQTNDSKRDSCIQLHIGSSRCADEGHNCWWCIVQPWGNLRLILPRHCHTTVKENNVITYALLMQNHLPHPATDRLWARVAQVRCRLRLSYTAC